MVVHFHRLYYFFRDFFYSHRFKYRSDRFVAYKVVKLHSNEFTRALIQKLRARRIPLLTIDLLLEEILACPKTKALYEEAQQAIQVNVNKKLNFRFVEKDKVPFGGLCDYAKGEILINADCEKNKALEILVFELLNAKQTHKFLEIHQQGLNGQILDAEEYARKKEFIEYDNHQMSCEIIRSAIEDNGWSPSIQRHKFQDFEHYIRIQQQGGHFQYYIDRFDKIKEYQKSMAEYQIKLAEYQRKITP